MIRHPVTFHPSPAQSLPIIRRPQVQPLSLQKISQPTLKGKHETNSAKA
jgi:hypothetical protein